MKICDVSNPSDIVVETTFLSDVGSESMAHNLIIKDNLVYVSHYHDGIWIWDISDPSNPVYVASYDTYTPAGHDSYKGAWGVYPLLPSGNILVSDMQSGLFIFAPPTANTNNIAETATSIIFPNPCQNMLNINTNSQNLKLIQVYDLYGKELISKNTMDSQISIDLSTLTQGVYVLQINDTNKKSTYSIVKN